MDKGKTGIKSKYLLVIILALISMWGGLYDFSAVMYGTVFSLLLLCLAMWKEQIILPIGMEIICLFIIFAGYVISVLVSTDKGMAVIGVLRQLVVLVFWIVWNNIDSPVKQSVKKNIAKAAAIVTTGAIAAYAVPSIRDYFFRAGRLGGVFQYSNTYAVFLLLCCFFVLNMAEKELYNYLMIGSFLAGIFLSGSRSVVVLTLIVIVLFAITNRKERKYIVLLTLISAAVCLVLQFALQLDLIRIFKLSLNSSTLNGRILYWRDGFHVLLKHWFGMGYMGYYFKQATFQTGNYITKFVHNDILQCGLDAGIIPMAALFVMILVNICSKKNTQRNRAMLLIILLHMLFDFDMQYMSMVCIMLMCLKEEPERTIALKKSFLKPTAGILVAGFGYFAIAFGFGHFQMYEQSLKMYPGNTFVRTEYMNETGDVHQAEVIIQTNGMVAGAYEYKIQDELNHGEYKEALAYIGELLDCAGYNIELYNQAVYYYSIALSQAIEEEDADEANAVLEDIRNVPDRLEKLKERTTTFAYRINDEPDFILNEEIQKYIDKMSGIKL